QLLLRVPSLVLSRHRGLARWLDRILIGLDLGPNARPVRCSQPVRHLVGPLQALRANRSATGVDRARRHDSRWPVGDSCLVRGAGRASRSCQGQRGHEDTKAEAPERLGSERGAAWVPPINWTCAVISFPILKLLDHLYP